MSHRNKNAMDWIPASRTDVVAALERIPAGNFLLTSSHTDQRGGVPVKWVQQCCETPPMVMVAVEKGHSLSPVIRDSRTFALCQLDPADRGTLRSFQQQQPGSDPFMGLLSTNAPSGAPVPARALAYIDCELARHVDIDGDHEIYVGVVHHASALHVPADVDRCLCDKSTVHRAADAAPVIGPRVQKPGVASSAIRAGALRAASSNGNGHGTNGAARSASGNGTARMRLAGGTPRTGSRMNGTREAAAKLDRARKRR